MHNELVQLINEKVPSANATAVIAEVGDSSIFVEANSIKEVCELLKSSEEYEFNVLQVITGCDYEDRIEVSYVIASFTKNLELILKVKVERGTNDNLSEIPSVTSVWSSANWQERECYDLIGVNFVGHPKLERILCCYDWEGHPLRKDYVAQKEYHGMEVYPEHKINTDDHMFATRFKETAEDPKKVTGSWKV